jgi:hypothetical protein
MNRLRPVVDQIMFPNYYRRIQFAALGLADQGLASYGSCAIWLKSDMIENRASVFDSNTLIWLLDKSPRFEEILDVSPGYRATWGDRARLAVAKLAPLIRHGLSIDEFDDVLLHRGANTKEDDFIEVHIWGKLTSWTIQSVHLGEGKDDTEHLYLNSIRDILHHQHIPVMGGGSA